MIRAAASSWLALGAILAAPQADPEICSPAAVTGALRDGRYLAAEACARSLAARDGPEAPDAAWDKHAALAEALLANGRGATAEALAAARSALELRRAAAGPDEAAPVRELLLLGRVRRARGEAGPARELFDEAVATARRRPDEVSALAQALLDAADARRRLSLYPQALALCEQAWGLARGAGLAEEQARALEIRAETRLAVGALADARADLEQALALRESLAPEHPETAQTYGLLGNALNAEARADEAQAAYQRALELLQARLGASHPRLVWPLGRVAGHVVAHDLAAGLRLHEHAVSMALEQLGPEHPETGARLNDLANARLASGDTDGARKLYERALALGPDEPEPQRSRRVATVHYNLSEVAARSGDLALSVTEAREAVRLWRQGEGAEHRFVAVGLEGLGDSLERHGQTDEALAAFEEALALRRRVLGDAHPETGALAARVGLARLALGQTERARAAEAVAAAALERARARSPLLATRTLHLQARLAWSAERWRESARLALAADDLTREYVRRTVRYLGEHDALAAIPARFESLDLAAAVAARHDTRLARDVFEHVLRSRALVLDELTARARVETQAPRQRLRLASQRLATLLYRSTAAAPEAAERLLADARHERDAAERALALQSADFAREVARDDAGADELARALPPRSALISYLRYEAPLEARADATAGPRYLAFVWRAGQHAPRSVALASARLIDDAVARWRREAGNVAGALSPAAASRAAAQQRYDNAAEDLARLVWRPLQSHLGRSTRVYLVPDGALHAVSFDTLREGRRYVLEGRREIHYLATERDLLAAPRPTGVGLLALGGAAYDAPLGEVARAADARLAQGERRAQAGDGFGRSTSDSGFAGLLRGRRSACDRADFENLPQSGLEAREVAQAWRRFGDDENDAALALMGADASVELVAALAPGRRVIHLATHGFFFDAGCAGRDVTPRARESPLLRSGLVLAGANRRGEAQVGEEDGILTSEEIAHLDWGPVEWVVLSACDTGRGAIHSSEGVLGLRRAVQRAGARTVISSLWSVEDGDARAWMAELYLARWRDHAATPSAMRRAGLARLRALQRSGGGTHPARWGAFVAVGDWR